MRSDVNRIIVDGHLTVAKKKQFQCQLASSNDNNTSKQYPDGPFVVEFPFGNIPRPLRFKPEAGAKAMEPDT